MQFFSPENLTLPPSISEVLSGVKSILPSLLDPTEEVLNPPNFFVSKVFDGAAVLHFLPTTAERTFNEYAKLTKFSFLYFNNNWYKHAGLTVFRIDIFIAVSIRLLENKEEVVYAQSCQNRPKK